MTERPDFARLAAKALAEGSAALPRPSPSPEQEARAKALVAGAIRDRARRGRRRRWAAAGAGVAAAAVIVLASVAVLRRHPLADGLAAGSVGGEGRARASAAPAGAVEAVVGDAYLIRGSEGRSVIEGASVAAGDRFVVQHGGHVAVLLKTGTRLGLDEGADLTVIAQGASQLFRLASGSLRADVHKLGPNERFIMSTRDVEVEVRGTSFRLADGPPDLACGGTTTHLSVYEGVVTVRFGMTETAIAAGQTWPRDCQERGQSRAAATDEPLIPASPSAGREGPSQDSHSGPRAPRSTLGDQNDLYARALAARDRGDVGSAVRAFEQLMSKYPSAPLTESAAAERMKLLAAERPERAVAAARDYLVRYPAGFARDQAEETLRKAASDR